MKKLLMIINPKAGTKQATKYLADIIDVFCRGGYETVVATTAGRGHGTQIARERAGDADVVVAVGGDGTFNEVVAGVMESGADVPIGYLPAGTTNDFAASLGIPKNLVEAARAVVTGTPRTVDIGSFNGRYFSYVASFGAFTGTSYGASQSLKNLLGHMAYILEGVRDVLSIKPLYVELKNEVGVYGNKYLFGAVCNSTSMGGIVKLDADVVDMNDGLFEVLLVRAPSNILELNQEILALTSQNYENCPLISFFTASELTVKANPEMNWTLDGEYQEGTENIVIKNLKSAVRIILNDERENNKMLKEV